MAELQDGIRIEMAWLLAEGELRCQLHLPGGSTATEALERAVQSEGWPAAALDGQPLGIFSRRIEPAHVLQDGDRLELYRALQLDPKDARRRRAARTR